MVYRSSGPFIVQADSRNGVVRLALSGELDLSTVPVLDEHLSFVERDGARALVIDLRDVTFFDSTGIQAFLRASSLATQKGLRFAIVGASDTSRRLLELTRTDDLLDELEGLRLLTLFTQGSDTRASRALEEAGTHDG